MAKPTKKKKRKLPKLHRGVVILSVVVLWLALIFVIVTVLHSRSVAKDRARFEQANKDVQTVASQIVAAVRQPQDRKDGGKCSYAHQKYSKGPLSCEVYSYLAYGVNSPDDVNAIVQKAEGVVALHGNPWKFEQVTEKPHQFVDGVNYSDNFVPLSNLFDREVRTVNYADVPVQISCVVGYLYHNSVAKLVGYPDFATDANQSLLVDIDCSDKASAQHFTLED